MCSPTGADNIGPLIRGCPTLKTLVLNNTGVGTAGGESIGKSLMAAWEASGGSFQLETFILGRSRLEDPGCISISAALGKIGTLREIRMPQNGIQVRGIKALARALRTNPHMRVLELADNGVRATGAVALARGLRHCKELRALLLDSALIKDTGGLAIVETVALHCKALEVLDVSYNDMGLKVLRALVDKLGGDGGGSVAGGGGGGALRKLLAHGNAFGENVGMPELVKAFGDKLVEPEDIETEMEEVTETECSTSAGETEEEEEDKEGGGGEGAKGTTNALTGTTASSSAAAATAAAAAFLAAAQTLALPPAQPKPAQVAQLENACAAIDTLMEVLALAGLTKSEHGTLPLLPGSDALYQLWRGLKWTLAQPSTPPFARASVWAVASDVALQARTRKAEAYSTTGKSKLDELRRQVVHESAPDQVPLDVILNVMSIKSTPPSSSSTLRPTAPSSAVLTTSAAAAAAAAAPVSATTTASAPSSLSVPSFPAENPTQSTTKNPTQASRLLRSLSASAPVNGGGGGGGAMPGDAVGRSTASPVNFGTRSPTGLFGKKQ